MAPAFATRNGLRYGSTTMLGIRRIRDVAAAAKPRATKGSRLSWPPASSHRWEGAGWSVNPNPSNPAASAAAATAAIPGPDTRSGRDGGGIIGRVMANRTDVSPCSAWPQECVRRSPAGGPASPDRYGAVPSAGTSNPEARRLSATKPFTAPDHR